MKIYTLIISLLIYGFIIGQPPSSKTQNKPALKKTTLVPSRQNPNTNDVQLVDKNSFEYNYNIYLEASVKNQKAFEYLKKAYEIYPDNVALYDDFMAYYDINENKTGRRQFSNKLAKSNTIPKYIMEYNYNVLASLPQNAVLFTNGFDDTYPIWITQDVTNFRKDIKVINIAFLDDIEYRNRILNKYNLKYSNSLRGKELITDLLKQNSNSNIFIGLTIDKSIIKALHDDLYLIGLTFQYSSTPVSNIEKTTNMWENSFIKTSLTGTPSSFKQKQVTANYLIPMIYIHNSYVESGEIAKAKALKKLILKIAKYNGKLNIVNAKLK